MSKVAAPLVQLDQVSLIFSGKKILNAVDFAIEPLEIVSLIGPNGAGKSSLIKVVLGLQVPHQGKRQIQRGLRMGYVPQRVHLSPSLPMRVKDLFALARPSRQQLDQVIDEVGVSGLLETAMQQLSGGERQRVLLARALLQQPDLLVLDEPMQGLDLQSETELYQYVCELPQRHGCAVLIVSHDLQWVMQGTQRVLCLNQHICCSGTPAQVQRAPEYQALFGAGRVWYEHHHDHCQHTDLHAVDEQSLSAVAQVATVVDQFKPAKTYVR